MGDGSGGRGLRVGGHLAYQVSLPGAPRFCLFVITDLTLNLPNKKTGRKLMSTQKPAHECSFVHDCLNLEVIELSLNR